MQFFFLLPHLPLPPPPPPPPLQVRVCHDDSDYYSYTEIPIECVSQGLSYSLVQVFKFVMLISFI